MTRLIPALALESQTITIHCPPPPAGRWPNPPAGQCENCGNAPAVTWFVADGMPDANHGGAAAWCRRCALEAQIDHCEKAAARLPVLIAELRAMGSKVSP